MAPRERPYRLAVAGITGATSQECEGFLVTGTGDVEVTLADGGTMLWAGLAVNQMVEGFSIVAFTANTTATVTAFK